ncbi:MAG: polyhydroxyalkanoate depolymerase [Rhodospirillaceae bacterium]|jgi:poly(3-hydroxybutyrate) depolymerase|nr:polyhydroxyalkanoate depolymerase [Rhodospirillaceae bacterium]
MLYHAYELTHAALAPMKALCEVQKSLTDAGLNPWIGTPGGRMADAAVRWFDGVTKRYGRPDWGITEAPPKMEMSTAFCDLAHFEAPGCDKRPKVLLVAPLSGHYPTLVRGTAQAMLKDHDVYVTDWHDARLVPVAQGEFGLSSFIDTCIEFMRHLGPDLHVIAVCQPAVPVLAAVAHMAALEDPCQPKSMMLMGGPIDARINPTPANEMVRAHDLAWFEQSVISRVPVPHPGAMRQVYPGFVQLSGFLFKNLDRHIDAQVKYFDHLVAGDGSSAEQHRSFYEEFLAVMDLPAAFFLETIETVFQDFSLARGSMTHKGLTIDPGKIKKTRLMTVEGGNDDICPPGQTLAAHDLCSGLPKSRKAHYLHPKVGHYGVFNGSRWRADIAPRVAAFIAGAAKP